MRWLVAAVAASLLAACASMGRPQGGPRDVDPPVFVNSTPAPGEVNVSRSKISILFDENVQVTDPMSKVVISPAQRTTPLVMAAGRRIDVELRDSMKSNTTYTVEFSDAISDLNEGNPIDGFSFAFSTGPHIDTLQISGMVLCAENLEPAQGMLVGAYANLSDTAIMTLPFDRITKTNQLGQFTIRNLAPGSYRVYAVNDNNRDYHWDRSEDVAFLSEVIVPSVSEGVAADTLEAADGSDSIVMRPAAVYAPDDVLLTWFNENYRPQYLVKNERPDRHLIELEMGAHADALPELTVINGPYAGRKLADMAVINGSATLDTLQYWLTDSTLIMQDTIALRATYLRTDSLDQLSPQTDTLQLMVRGLRQRLRREEQERKKQLKEWEERRKRGEEVDTTPKPVFLTVRMNSSSVYDVFQPIGLAFSQPLESLDMNGVHLLVKDNDTTWVEVEPPMFDRDGDLRPMQYVASYEWEPGATYKLEIDSLAAMSVYKQGNAPFSQTFSVRKESDYSTITFNVAGLDSVPAVVELLSSADKPLRRRPVADGKAVFDHVLPNTYYARLFIDSNGNGQYDSGSLTEGVQPEEVYYFPKKMPLKQRWDMVQNWNVYELPLDAQKPLDIKKNKPKPKPGEKNSREDEEDDEYDEYDSSAGGVNRNTGVRRNSGLNNSRLRRNSDRTAY